MAEGSTVMAERTTIEKRKYQEVLSEYGRKRNIIVCLPTGSGKTMIAIYIMNSPEITQLVQREKKKIVFIVTTVQLAQQQAAVIAQYTPYKPLICTSASTKASSWTEERWKAEMNQNDVFVMIAQICFDKLCGNFLNFSQIALLVLDECHNATKHHTMNEIMGLYHKYAEIPDSRRPSLNGFTNHKNHKPRIIGLTATINKKKVKDISADAIADEIATLEKRMDCKAVIYEDMDEVQRFSTAGNIVKVLYETGPKSRWGDLLTGILSLQSFITAQTHKHGPMPGIMREALYLNLPNFSIPSTFRNKSDDYQGELNRVIMDFIEIYNDLGPLACSEMVQHKADWLNKLKLKIADKRSLHLLNIEALKTQFEVFLARVNSKVVNVNTIEGIQHFISYKLEVLLEHLQSYRFKEKTPDELLGLIFVKRRSYAKAIKTMLELYAETDPTQYGFLKPEIITGTNNNKRDNKLMRVSTSQQKQIIDSFRRGDSNLIICTTVLEEGIDVPDCNLVVRFDEIQAYTSFIQSMGRARKKGARFLAFIPIASSAIGADALSKFKLQHDTMTDVLKSQMIEGQKNGVALEDAFQNLRLRSSREEEFELDELIQDFCPVGPGGPKVTHSSAIPLVFMYVQKDQGREIVSWWGYDKPDPKEITRKFRAYIFITGKTVIRNVVEGPLMPCSETAKKAAFMEVCKQLYYAGALGPHLLPC